MKKEKKITVKFFLHSALKPIVEGKVKRYPLYMAITYNRQNMMMRSHKQGFYKDLNEIERVTYPGFLAFEERIVKKTIAYEVLKQGDNFDLKGLYKKYEVYVLGIDELLTPYMKNVLWDAVMRCEPQEYAFALNFNDPKVRFEALYGLSKRAFDNLDKLLGKDFAETVFIYQNYTKLYNASFFQYTYPTVIEWLDGSAITDYKEKLEAIHPKDTRMVEKSLALINQIVQARVAIMP